MPTKLTDKDFLYLPTRLRGHKMLYKASEFIFDKYTLANTYPPLQPQICKKKSDYFLSKPTANKKQEVELEFFIEYITPQYYVFFRALAS